MPLHLPEPRPEHSPAPGGEQLAPSFDPPNVINSDHPITEGPPFSDPSSARYGSSKNERETAKNLMENFHNIAKLVAESLSWGDPNDPQIGRSLVNSLRLAFRYGSENGEKAMIADINSHLLAPLAIERVDELPPISCGTSYQRVYILTDRQTGRSVPLAMFEIH